MRQRLTHLLSALRSPFRVQNAQIRWKLRRAGLSSTVLKTKDGTLHSWVGSNGPPLLLLQGFGSDAKWQWHPQIRSFAKKRRLFLPDLMFFGSSRSTSRERSLDFQARMVLTLMDHHQVETFDLMGISYGGLVAYHLARNWPDRVKKLVMVGTPGPVMTPTDYDDMLTKLGVDDIADVMVPSDPEGLRRLIQIAYHHPPRVPKYALRDAYEHLFTEQVSEKRQLLSHLLEQMTEQSEVESPVLPHETLLVWGRHDRVFPVDLGRRFRARLRPNSQLHVIDRAAHAPSQALRGRGRTGR